MRPPKIVFLVMSAIHPAMLIKELSQTLAPHTVLVHHDYSQTSDLVLDEPNVVFIPEPKRTGWGIWGFTEGVFHSIKFALRNLDLDYLQVLSPTCLPIKPLKAFEQHVADHKADVDFSGIDLYEDHNALMSVGYRMFAAKDSIHHRILRRLSVLYFGNKPTKTDVAGVQLRTRSPANLREPWRVRLALGVTQTWAKQSNSHHIFDDSFRPFFGSAWFGARRNVLEWVVERFNRPDIARQFSKAHIPEELAIPTLLKNSGFKTGQLNHCIVTFHDANPKWLDDEDFDFLARSPAFFARKFPVEQEASIRRRVLTELVHKGN